MLVTLLATSTLLKLILHTVTNESSSLYSRFKAPTNESLVFALKQTLFKLSTITFSAQKSRAKATLDLAEKALHSDIQLFFAYLMSLERVSLYPVLKYCLTHFRPRLPSLCSTR